VIVPNLDETKIVVVKVHESSVETLTMVGLALFAVGARDSPSIADRQRAREQGRC